MPTCNKDNMRKWVAALRSGSYQQGGARLLKDGKYCCLGVACDVAMRNGAPVSIENDYYESNVKMFKGPEPHPDCSPKMLVKSSASLPDVVREWLGVDDANPHVADDTTAWRANDSLQWSFDSIADNIEDFYELREDPA